MFASFRQLHWSIFALAIASGVLMTGFMMLLPLLPGYAEQLGFGEFDIGLLVAAFFIGRVLFQFPLGVLSDRIGRRGIMSGALLLFTISTTAYALTTEPRVMMSLRLLQGVASSGFVVGSQSYINDLTPTEFRGLANGIISSAINIGVIAGPLLGGVLSQLFNIQTPFIVGGILGGLCFLLSLAIPRISISAGRWPTGGDAAASEDQRHHGQRVLPADVLTINNSFPGDDVYRDPYDLGAYSHLTIPGLEQQ